MEGTSANALVKNDNSQTPLDVARTQGDINVVRGIEGHLCLFSGWLRGIRSAGFLDILAPQLFSRKVWVVVLPCGSGTTIDPFILELAIYAGEQDVEPQKIIRIRTGELQQPNFDQPDPVAIIYDISGSQIKLGPMLESATLQLQRFCNACKGIRQVSNVQMTTPPSDDKQLAMAIKASLQSAERERYASQVDSSLSSAIDKRTPIDFSVGEISGTGVEKKKDGSASTCTICLDASVEGACVPCGHMAGCMSCLNEIKAKKWSCPICRTKVNQVVRLYAV